MICNKLIHDANKIKAKSRIYDNHYLNYQYPIKKRLFKISLDSHSQLEKV